VSESASADSPELFAESEGASAQSLEPLAESVGSSVHSSSAQVRQKERTSMRTRRLAVIGFSVLVLWVVVFKSGSRALTGDAFEAAGALWFVGAFYRARRRRKHPFETPIAGTRIFLAGLVGALGIAGGGRLLLEVETGRARADVQLIRAWKVKGTDELRRGVPISPPPDVRSHLGEFLRGWNELWIQAESTVSASKPIPIAALTTELPSKAVLAQQIAIRKQNLATYSEATTRMGDYIRRCEDSPAWIEWPRSWTRESCTYLRSTLTVAPTAINLARSEFDLLIHLATLPKYSEIGADTFSEDSWQREYERLAGLYNAASSETIRAYERLTAETR
jgi:hypothetical protein